jgi:hypothetical protein
MIFRSNPFCNSIGLGAWETQAAYLNGWPMFTRKGGDENGESRRY